MVTHVFLMHNSICMLCVYYDVNIFIIEFFIGVGFYFFWLTFFSKFFFYQKASSFIFSCVFHDMWVVVKVYMSLDH